MRRSRRSVTVLGCAFAVLGAAAALAADPIVRQGNLDKDAEAEDVRAEDIHPERPPEAPHWRVRISDTCPEGDVSAVVSGTAVHVESLAIVKADTRRGKEAFFRLNDFTRSQDEYGVIAWRAFDTAPCRRPRALFRHPSPRTKKPPRGTTFNTSQIALKNYSRSYRGKEIRLWERFLDRDDAECCPSIVRRTSYRYHRGRDRYVAYHSVVRDREAAREPPPPIVCAGAGAAC